MIEFLKNQKRKKTESKHTVSEGFIAKLNKENEDPTVAVNLDVPKEVAKIEKDDKQSFEDFKTMYKTAIDLKCQQDYDTVEDSKLWEDCAKELYLQSKNYIMTGDEYKPKEELDKEVKTESKLLNEDSSYYSNQLDKVDGSIDDDYAIQIENRTMGTKTNFMNVHKDIVNMLRSYFNNADLQEGSSTDRYQLRKFTNEYGESKGQWGAYDTKEDKFVQKGSKTVMQATVNDLNSKKIKKESKYDNEPSQERYKQLIKQCFDWIEAHISSDDYHSMLDQLGISQLEYDRNIVKPTKYEEVINNAIGWIIEHTADEEDTINRQLGITPEEKEFFGITFDSELRESKDDTIKKAVDIVAKRNNGIITDDSKYDIIEEITGISDIDKMPKELIDKVTKYMKSNLQESNAIEFVELVDKLKQLDLWDGKDETFKDAVKKYYEIQETNKKLNEDIDRFLNADESYRYQLLDRMRSDCDYFLGNGNGFEGHLWAHDVETQIKYMKQLWNTFSDDKKPEWLTMEDIENYEKEMKDKLQQKNLESTENKMEEGFFNLYNSYNDLYSISKMSPKELINFITDLKDHNRISDKDYNILKSYADKWQALIDGTGYESSLVESKLQEDQYENERRKGRPNIKKIAEEIYEEDPESWKRDAKACKDVYEFTKQYQAELSAEWNLSFSAVQDVCMWVYAFATDHPNTKKAESKSTKIINEFKANLMQKGLQESKVFNDKDLKKYLTTITKEAKDFFIPENVGDDFKYTLPEKGEFYNDGEVLEYDINVTGNRWYDFNALADELKSKLSDKLKTDSNIDKVFVNTEHRNKDVYLNIALTKPEIGGND